MSFTQTDAADMVRLTLHDELSIKRFKHSKLPGTFGRKPGAIFVVRTKPDLEKAHGIVMTSVEATVDSLGASHWTPNIFRYGTYANKSDRYKLIKGHTEDNLRAITCFVVDADFGDSKPDSWSFDYSVFDVQINNRHMLTPTYVLETPHGYQAYYVLAKPVWVRRKDGNKLPALTAAKRISQHIREAVAKELPQTDTGANHFGFFRMPNEENIKDINEDAVEDFARLMKWSLQQDEVKTPKARRTLQLLTDQVDTAWFRALTEAKVPCAGHNGYGRNNVLFTLCLAMFSSSRSEADAYDYADQWNSGQLDPLKDREVQNVVRSAYSGRYHAATKEYIQELVNRYAPGVQVQGSLRTWYKFKKDREDRQYSHLKEWRDDLLDIVASSTNRRSGVVRFTVHELQDLLGISKQSLNCLLKDLSAVGAMYVRRVRGCNGGLYLATAQMIQEWTQEQKVSLQAAFKEHLPIPLQQYREVKTKQVERPAAQIEIFGDPPQTVLDRRL